MMLLYHDFSPPGQQSGAGGLCEVATDLQRQCLYLQKAFHRCRRPLDWGYYWRCPGVVIRLICKITSMQAPLLGSRLKLSQ